MKISFAVLLCLFAIVTGVISKSLWKGKLSGVTRKTNVNNPGLLVIRHKGNHLKESYKHTQKGLACLVSTLYAVTAAFVIKDHEGKEDCGGLFTTHGQRVKKIDKLYTCNEYNPKNQYEYDIGIIKLKEEFKTEIMFDVSFNTNIMDNKYFTFYGYNSPNNKLSVCMETYLVNMHSNYDNKRKDKSIYLAPYRINEILDDNDIGGPVLIYGAFIGVISKFSTVPNIRTATLFGTELIKNFITAHLSNTGHASAGSSQNEETDE